MFKTSDVGLGALAFFACTCVLFLLAQLGHSVVPGLGYAGGLCVGVGILAACALVVIIFGYVGKALRQL